MLTRGGNVKWRLAHDISSVMVSSTIQQQRNHAALIALSRVVKGCVPASAAQVSCAALQEKSHRLHVATLRRCHQRRVLIGSIAIVHITAAIKCSYNSRDVPGASSRIQIFGW